jgi:3-phenylpropionate/trans-cinnamate dioxygenase ferredoxin reductase subunit
MDKIVIVGTGQAGVQAAISLRDEGYEGALTLVGEEPGWPYQRPPLSKAYLLGKMDDEGILLRAPSLYADNRIEVIDGVRVEAIERLERWVRLSDGRTLDYDHLVLATGARQRPLPASGAQLDGVLDLRTLQDAKALKARIGDAKGAVVVGGGFIGLEFAAVARAQGVAVTVVEIADRVMARALTAEMSAFFQRKHEAWGVDFRFGVGLREIRGDGRVREVALGDGSFIDADLVLVGIGVIANSELAAEAGLAVANGIVVDELLSTSDPAISAIGDVAQHPNRFSAEGPVRLESVQNAADQGRLLAARLMGKPRPYDAVPWFWSDQGDLKLQMAGLNTGHDQVVLRGDPQSGAFSVFCFKAGRLLAVESVNKPADHIAARRLIQAGAPLTAEQAADESTPLKAYIPAAKV